MRKPISIKVSEDELAAWKKQAGKTPVTTWARGVLNVEAHVLPQAIKVKKIADSERRKNLTIPVDSPSEGV